VVIIEDERERSRACSSSTSGRGFSGSAATGQRASPRARKHKARCRRARSDVADQSGYVVQGHRAIEVGDAGGADAHGQGRGRDRILGLEVGADDLVVKPFVVRECAAGDSAGEPAGRAPRPTGRGDPSGVLKVGPIELDPVTHDVKISGVPHAAAPARR